MKRAARVSRRPIADDAKTPIIFVVIDHRLHKDDIHDLLLKTLLSAGICLIALALWLG